MNLRNSGGMQLDLVALPSAAAGSVLQLAYIDKELEMFKPLAATLALMLLTLGTSWPVVAWADSMDECRRALSGEARVAACTAVIKGAQFDVEQKASALRIRADARSMAGALADAATDYSEALKLRPQFTAALAGRGRVRVMQNDFAGALDDYSAAIDLAPRSSHLFMERGHAHLARGDADAAISDMTEAIRLNPSAESAFNNRGLAHRRKGDLEKAHSDYTAALTLNPIYPQAYANRGYLEEMRGRKTEAIADLRSALLLDPSIVGAKEALRRLGVLDSLTVESDRRIAQGKSLVDLNCSRCHAVGNAGNSPNPKAPEFHGLHLRHPLRALREPLRRGIAAPHDEMPRFQLSNADIDSIVAYINSLSAGR
jgi:tetratricopeptide (TPR) repeat protein